MREAIDLLHLYPNLSALVLVHGSGIDCEAVARSVKDTPAKVPVIHLSALLGSRCGPSDHKLSSHEPEELLNLVRSLLGDPRTTDGQ